jgi:pyruvate dehydrogenase E1 component
MFGFQRTGDLIWAFGDLRGRGFLLGGTAGRTTLNGEGLQHEDGHSLVLASTIPNLRAYDPAFAYETAVIIQDGIRRMYTNGFDQPEGDCFYYITLYNENYVMPAMPEGDAVPGSPQLGTVTEGIARGLYRFSAAPDGGSRRATILFSGSASQAAIEAQRILADEWDCGAELWSATSYKALREEALSVERANRLHPSRPDDAPWVEQALAQSEGPVVAVTDFMKQLPEMISRWVPRPFVPLGTDGYGRSDTRAALRRHFETDAAHVVVAVLSALVEKGEAKAEEVADAIGRYGLDADAPDPRTA